MTNTTWATGRRIPAIAMEALAFFQRPHPMRPVRGALSAQRQPLLALLALNLGVLFLLLPLLILWSRTLGIEPPRMMHDIPELMVLVMAVAILPPLEEVVFRGWMTGRPAALALLAGALAIGLVLSPAHAMQVPFLIPTLVISGLVVTLAAVWFLRRREAAPGWFTRNFKWWFWGSTLLFASAHYSNYPALTPAHLPLVLPQLWSGLVFGFTRLRFGLLRSILLHCASNAFVLLAFFLFGIPSA